MSICCLFDAISNFLYFSINIFFFNEKKPTTKICVYKITLGNNSFLYIIYQCHLLIRTGVMATSQLSWVFSLSPTNISECHIYIFLLHCECDDDDNNTNIICPFHFLYDTLLYHHLYLFFINTTLVRVRVRDES